LQRPAAANDLLQSFAVRAWVLVPILAAASSTATAAEPVHVLRLASAVPEGTAWAREGKAFAREVEALTHGQVHIKWYLSGIAGDEMQVGERIQRRQLDGVGSGGPLCAKLAPSMRVTRLLGLFQDRDESAYVLGRLKPELDEEFKKSGFTNLWEAGLGPEVLFTRTPVRSLAELRRSRLWIWDLDDLYGAALAELGVHTVALPLDAAAHAYDSGASDGFITLPTAALAFQWSAQSRYVSDLPLGFLTGCLLVANRAFDALPVEAQQAILTAAAKFQARMEEVGRQQDEALLGGLFKRQGLTTVPVSEGFRQEFFEQARTVRDRAGDRWVPLKLRVRVTDWLAGYRAEQHR
jgi:TRAP-type C4-dicarboxylate transport system substrate-binding protein